MFDDLSPLEKQILYLIAELQDRDALCTDIRIAKFLYLADVEAMRTHGRAITGLEWKYHHFGPWAGVLPSTMQRLAPYISTEEVRTREGHLARVRRLEEWVLPDCLVSLLPYVEQSVYDRLLNRWADEDIQVLLDYVYHHTEPMVAGHRGEFLDLSKARQAKPSPVAARPSQEEGLMSFPHFDVITSLPEPEYRLCVPIEVTIDEDDDHYLVADDLFLRFGVGDTIEEAKLDYSFALLDYFDELRKDPDRLCAHLAHDLELLEQCIITAED